MMPKVWTGKITDPIDVCLKSALDWLQWSDLVPHHARVVIKPNLTYPFYKPGVTTSPTLLEALVALLTTRTRDITIVESDGGSYAWPAEEAFKGHGIDEICQRYGARAVNLTTYPREWAETEVLGRRIRLEMSRLLLRETDVFITMPVPKVHVMTRVSLGFKNQWGCLPDVKRLRHHSDFSYKILAINQLLQPRLAIFDGTYFLNRTGPMEGDAVKMDLMIAANDVGAGSLVCCALMQIEPRSVTHLRLAQRAGMMPSNLDAVELSHPLQPFLGPKFVLQRSLLHWLTLGVFHSHLATRIAYDSSLAQPLHDILYFFRGRPKDFAPRWGNE
jgi:uncharacterized protein (DUF362 family)